MTSTALKQLATEHHVLGEGVALLASSHVDVESIWGSRANRAKKVLALAPQIEWCHGGNRCSLNRCMRSPPCQCQCHAICIGSGRWSGRWRWSGWSGRWSGLALDQPPDVVDERVVVIATRIPTVQDVLLADDYICHQRPTDFRLASCLPEQLRRCCRPLPFLALSASNPDSRT